ncbi:MAG: exodeoxyribonuclease VII large subunit [Alphaproteobacteria bacterium]|nr:exodeoxyribonuclease VII large subunit [Alphaproteobacteria bacterium]
MALQRTVEGVFGRLRVRGEVTNLKRPSSGHWYFDIKDTDSIITAVCWRSTAIRLRTNLEDGQEVIVTGRLTTYPGRSQYQIVVDQAELAGAGALLKQLDARRKKLAAEGLFDRARKRKLPSLPSVIGVVTSPTGAVFRDILHRLRDRFPRRVLLWPVSVQGADAAPDIAAAIHGFSRIDAAGAVPRPDVLIVARGGGSVEDLWAFNEEIVVRAIAASQIPVISAVGHETDTTLSDFAADVCAPTPTAAAELAVPVRAELIAATRSLSARLFGAATRALDRRRERLRGLARGLRGPRELLEVASQRVDHAGMRLGRAQTALLGDHGQRLAGAARTLRPRILRRGLDDGSRRLTQAGATLQREARRRLKERARELEALATLLDSVSHKSVLQRGYAVVRDAQQRPVTTAEGIAPGMPLDIELKDGHIDVVTGSVKPSPQGSSSGPSRKATPKRNGSSDQGTLL